MSDGAMRLVLVRWVDAYGVSANWQDIPADIKPTPLTVESVGWVVTETGDCLVVVPHLSQKGHEHADQQGCGDMTIPKVAILSIKDLCPARCAAAAVMRDPSKSKTAKVKAGKALTQR